MRLADIPPIRSTMITIDINGKIEYYRFWFRWPAVNLNLMPRKIGSARPISLTPLNIFQPSNNKLNIYGISSLKWYYWQRWWR